jgi:ankyrin repeat protein
MVINKLHESCLQQNISLPPLVDPWANLPPENQSPQSFMYALQRGDLAQVRIYLDGGIPVDYHFEDGGGTPLVIAASAGQAIVASLLLQSGAFVNASDSGDYTSLHWAAFYGHTTIASLLLKNSANIDAKQNTGNTPLLLAVVRNQPDIVALLLKNGANSQIAGTEGKPMDIALKRGANVIVTLLRDASLQK